MTFKTKKIDVDTLPEIDSRQATVPLEELVARINQETGGSSDISQELKDLNKTDRDTGDRVQFIKFYLENIMLGIPLRNAIEISHLPNITPLPNLPNWVLGVSNIRGEIISMVDLKLFLSLPSQASTGRKIMRQIIITFNQAMKVCLVVDQVMGILSLSQSDSKIQSSPYEEGEIAKFISGIVSTEDKILNILDIDKLLSSARMDAFKSDA